MVSWNSDNILYNTNNINVTTMQILISELDFILKSSRNAKLESRGDEAAYQRGKCLLL